MSHDTAALPVAEIIQFTPKERYLSDYRDAVAGLAKILTDTSGCVSVHHGLELEEPESGERRGFILVSWQTLEHSQALRSDPDASTKLELAMCGEAKDVSAFLVSPKHDPMSCFAAGALEVSVVKLETGCSGKDIVAPLDDLMAYKASGHVGKPTWGQVHGEKDRVVLFVGWLSVEAHAQVRDSEEVLAVTRGVFGKIGKHLDGRDEACALEWVLVHRNLREMKDVWRIERVQRGYFNHRITNKVTINPASGGRWLHKVVRQGIGSTNISILCDQWVIYS